MNRTRVNRRATSVGMALCFMALSLCATARAQTPRDEILAATLRLEKTLSQLGLAEADAKARASELKAARLAAESGQLYLSLYRLQPVWVELSAQSYLREKNGLVKTSDAFEQEWKALGLALAMKEKRLAAASNGMSPAAVVALAESSITQARPYYQSGRLYGLNTTLSNGLYYMGLAPGQLDFAIFCCELRFPKSKAQLKLRTLGPELAKFEAQLLESYKRPEASTSQPLYNRINSTLKIATELDREGRYAGALQKYLEALIFLRLVDAETPDRSELPRLFAQSEALATRLKSADSSADHSIGLMFLEAAQGRLNAARSASDGEDLRRAFIILNELLPGYFQYVSGDK